MAKRDAKSWSAIVAEAESSGVAHGEVAAKHGVSVAALKYHLYKARGAASKAAPRVLPVRVADERRTFQVQLGALQVTFSEGCEPAYVAAVLGAVGKIC